MADTYTSSLYLTKPESGASTGWDTSLNNNFAYMDAALAPAGVYWVSPAFTAANLGNGSATDRRHFDTIQAAITAAEGDSYDDRNIIMVYPGRYGENLTITGSITLVGVHQPHMGFLGGMRSTVIRGQAAVQSPVITINQADEETISVHFVNIGFENYYNASNIGLIDKAYLLQFNSNAPNFATRYGGFIGFTNCSLRLQTWGAHNDWAAGIRISGYADLFMDNVEIASWYYAGGELDGGIARLIDAQNDDGTPESRKSNVYLHRSNFNHGGYAGAGTQTFIYADNGVSVRACGCSFYTSTGGELYIDGGTGEQVFSGLGAGEVNAFPYNNSVGVNFTRM